MNSIVGRLDSTKVFCNSIGWVKSARALNSWMTSVSYARDRAPKYCIEIAWDSHYIKSKIAQIPMTVFAKLQNESCKAWGLGQFLLVRAFYNCET